MQLLKARACSATAVLMLAAVPPTAPAHAEETFAIDVAVSLSRAAAQRLAAEGEGMVVAAYYYGEPTAAGQAHVDEIGRIDLGSATVDLPGRPTTVRIGGSELVRSALRWVKGPVWVNINIWSARLSGPDNILDCDFFDGEIARATAGPVTLRCALIGEGFQPEARS